MSGREDTSGYGEALEQVRAGVVQRLRARREEIVQAIFARVHGGAFAGSGDDDAEYVAGLRAAVVAALGYGLEGIERGEEWVGQVPPVVSEQARRAARSGVGLDTVLRRYVVGHTLLGEFVMEEADRGDFPVQRSALREVLRLQAVVLDRLLEAITGEYRDELARVGRSLEQRRVERLRRLLAGEPVDVAEIDYDFDAWHLGVIATGGRAAQAVRGLQAGLHCRLLSVSHGQQTVWAWLGGRRRLDSVEIEPLLTGKVLPEVSLTVGEAGEGMEGWRLTHRQAQEALLVALRCPQRLTRFANVALLAPWLGDPARARSLVEIYLSPLDSLRDDGQALRQTLRAYFAAGHNIEATAAKLLVDRSTVRRRVRRIEQALGCPLDTRQAELEVAMRLEELHRDSDSADHLPKPSAPQPG